MWQNNPGEDVGLFDQPANFFTNDASVAVFGYLFASPILHICSLMYKGATFHVKLGLYEVLYPYHEERLYGIVSSLASPLI